MGNIKQKTVFIIFNKHNGVLFDSTEDKTLSEKFNKDHFVVKEYIIKEDEYFFGDLYTGKIYSISDKPLIREDDLEENFFHSIQESYSLQRQLIMIFDVLKNNPQIVKTPETEHMISVIDLEVKKYKRKLEKVKNDKDSFNFISTQECLEIAEKRLENVII